MKKETLIKFITLPFHFFYAVSVTAFEIMNDLTGGWDPTYKFLSEIGNDRDKNSDCFIATTVYGNRDAPQVQTLRQFRDEVLNRSYLGRRAIDFYYGGFGEKAARYIKRSAPFAIPIIKRSLDCLVERYDSVEKQKVNSDSKE